MAEEQEHNFDAVETESMSSSSSELIAEGAAGGQNKCVDLDMTDKCSEEMQAAQSESESQLGGVDRLLQRHRSEIMFELRRLRHGDRPVTGQENRKNVEDFFMRAMAPEGATGGGPPPEEHRPEAVIVEVEGLVQRRPVSSILQSAAFRRSLENSIRGSLASIARNSSPLTRPRPSGSSSHAQQRTTSSGNNGANVPPPPPPPEPQGFSVMDLPAPREPRADASGTAAEQFPAAPLPPQPRPTRTQSWLQEQPAHIDPREQHQMSVWESMEQAHRENIIMDISDLVHQQLVTSTLEGQFRETLERQILHRVQSTGMDGQRTASYVRNIPQSQPHRRNDFSDLGILGAQGGAAASDSLDEISVISATAAVRVNNTQQNAYVNHEMRSLKAQMAELKQMMKLSFDLQLDIQRSIRQEVAAALTQALGTATQAPVAPSQPVRDDHCIICLDGHADSVLYQCGHLCLCYTCAKTLQDRAGHCPMCRAPIRDVLRVYKTSNGESE